MRRFIAVIIPLVVALAGPAKAAEVTSFLLENGLDVVVLEDHRAPAVVHMMWYRVGSADEPRGVSGIAHYLEHLMFKATDELESGEFSATVARNGGSDNAFTSYDYTAYFQRVASDRLELMMRMEASRMDGLALVEEDIATERDVVIEERNQRTENDPGALFGEQRRAAQFLSHPYGIPIIGWKHEAEALTLKDAVSFYEQHYGPNNAILIVAGDVEPDEVRRLAEQYYGVIPPNPNVKPRNRVTEPPQLAERRLSYADPRIGQAYVVRTYLAPERDAGAQEEAAALTLLAELLGGSSTTSFFADKLQFETQVAIYSAAFYSGLSLDDTTFGLVVVPSEGVSLAEAEAAMDQAVADFLEAGVNMEDLERIRVQIRASEIYEQDNLSSLARTYGAGLTSGLTIEDIQAWPQILADVTAEDIMAAAEKIFERRNAVTGWLMTEGSEELMQ
ncbi:M16 family metallopeptidase [Boseongicola aestuarii]|uniref:Protease 3 n=1 Tax=Boseongicola aestuarii TaxID=1470561 RepID=A0A238J3K0_9RHOB|nr:pitrilysin family protein [Boseongicola aestuarii]SMX24540.1 Protease 3 precursor [Boseongicola aestuarii]